MATVDKRISRGKIGNRVMLAGPSKSASTAKRENEGKARAPTVLSAPDHLRCRFSYRPEPTGHRKDRAKLVKSQQQEEACDGARPQPERPDDPTADRVV